MDVPGLQEGKEYMFRVKAVNDEGESEPLETDHAVLAKDPFSECLPACVLTCFAFTSYFCFSSFVLLLICVYLFVVSLNLFILKLFSISVFL